MQATLYKDPTLEGAQQLEIEDKRCAACARHYTLSDGVVRCGVGKVFPDCRGKKGGFVLIAGVDE